MATARLIIDIPELENLKEIMMGIKTAVEEMAAQLETIKLQLADGLNNISGDIQALTGQLAAAGTEAEVRALLQPKIDALQALGTLAAQIAAVVPENTNPPEGEL
jgi:hypothetical protein